MASGRVIFELRNTLTDAVLPAILVDDAVASAMARSGVDPDDVNVAVWPIGMRFHGEATLLCTRAAIRQFAEGAGTLEESNITLRVGVGSAVVEIPSLTIAEIAPVMSTRYSSRSEEGQNGLFVVRAVDARWRAYAGGGSPGLAVASVNVRGDDRARVWNGGSVVEYDAAIQSALAFMAPAPSILDAWGGSLPVDVPIASPGADNADRLCAETGRVLVPDLDGTFSVVNWDRTPASAWILPHADKILAGGAHWRTGAIGDDYIDDSTLLQSKARRGCPAIVYVRFLDWAELGRNAQPFYSVQASINAATYGLTGHRASTIVYDRLPSVGLNAVELASRANEVARAYYRRYLAGECDVLLMGAVAPTMGGGAQTVEWRASTHGVTTRVRASIDHPLLLPEDHRLRAIGVGGGGAVAGVGAMDEPVAIASRQNLVMGKIAAVNSGGTNYPANVTYDVVGPGGEDLGVFAEALTPRFRTFIGSGAVITPAAVGDPCILGFGPYTSSPVVGRVIELLATTESVTTQTCAGNLQARPTPDVVLDAILTDKRGGILTGKGGRILLSKSAGSETVAALDAILTDKHGNVLTGKGGRLLSSKAGDPAVQSLVDAVLSDKLGKPLVGKRGCILGGKGYG